MTITVSCSNDESTDDDFFSDDDDSITRRRLEVGGSSDEIARYVTPFGRRVGRWLTDITSLAPLMLRSCSEFVFQATAGGSPWLISSNLRLSKYGHGSSLPTNFSSLYSKFTNYNPTINVNNSKYVSVPAGVYKAELEAIITTHGEDSEFNCCEFLPTAHIFTVNDQVYNLTFNDAGTDWGCADRVADGSEPNEYGFVTHQSFILYDVFDRTWVYGRGGWCDGMDVKPWVVDVSAALDLNSEATSALVDYKTMIKVDDTWKDPYYSSSGYVIMSSNLVFYVNSTYSDSAEADVTDSSSGSNATSLDFQQVFLIVTIILVIFGVSLVGYILYSRSASMAGDLKPPVDVLTSEHRPLVVSASSSTL